MSVGQPSERWWLTPLVVTVLAVFATAPWWIQGIDLLAARWMQEWRRSDPGLSEHWWYVAAYNLPYVLVPLGLGLGLGSMAVAWLKPVSRHLLRPGLYLVLVIAIGNGLVVNALLKDHWGRPRPKETIELGGARTYLAPWVPGPDGGGKFGRSFPSGHASVPGIMLAFWLLWRRARPRLGYACLAAAIVGTAWVGMVRMAAGAHWLSDVLWALVIMYLVAVLLHRAVVEPGADGER